MLAGLPRTVHIHGVNGIGLESGNAENCAGRTIPWLQDAVGTDVWTSWNVAYRDVVILDADNVPVAVYNLTLHDLGVQASYEELRALLIQVASGP